MRQNGGTVNILLYTIIITLIIIIYKIYTALYIIFKQLALRHVTNIIKCTKNFHKYTSHTYV